MGCYLIAVGGTGNKILESAVYAAAADAFYTRDSQGKMKPLEHISLLSVDVDAACGNTTRAKKAAENYHQVWSAFREYPREHRCFHTEISLDQWSMNLSKRAASVEKMAQNHSRDRLLARLLFTPTEAGLEYSEGFRGHPDLGVLFFAELLENLEKARAEGQPDEMNKLLDQVDQDLARGEKVHLMLCGSIFGGTGASGIPALARFLHNRYKDRQEKFLLGAILMLPYYTVPAAQVDEEQEIAVKSSEFLDKARTALQYYGMEGLIRNGPEDPRGLFDAAYLLGLPQEQFVAAGRYSTGSQSQENDAHLLEWLAARCAGAFFRTDFRGENAHRMDCYYYQWHTPTLSWAGMDEEENWYREHYGALLKASVVYFSECLPTLRECFTHNASWTEKVGYVANFFRGARELPAVQRSHLEERFSGLTLFLGDFVRWFTQVVTNLPPMMKSKTRPAGRTIPPSDLVNAPLLEKLCALSEHFAFTPTLTPGKTEELSLSLQRGLHRLICAQVPDPRDMSRVIRGLNGAEAVAGSTDGAFASFASALLDVVME